MAREALRAVGLLGAGVLGAGCGWPASSLGAPDGSPGEGPGPGRPAATGPHAFAPGAPGTTDRIAAATDSDGRVEVLYVGADGALRHKRQSAPGGAWESATVVHSASGAPLSASAVAVMRDGGGKLEAFVVGEGAVLYHLRQGGGATGWSAPAPFFGAHARKVALAENPSGTLDVLFINASEALELSTQVASGGDTWSSPAQVAAPVRDMAVARGTGVEVVYADGSDALVARRVSPPGLGPPTRLGGSGRAVAAAVDRQGRVEVLFVQPGGALMHQAETSPGGAWGSAESLAPAASAVSIAREGDGALEAFYVDPHGNWQRTKEGAPGGGWSPPAQFGWSGQSLTSALDRDGRLEVFYTDASGRPFHDWQLTPGSHWAGEYPFNDQEQTFVSVDTAATRRILSPRFPDWHLDDHTIVRGDDGTWHVFSIAARNPAVDAATLTAQSASALVEADVQAAAQMTPAERATSKVAQAAHPFMDYGSSRSLTSGWTYGGGEGWYASERLFHEQAPPGEHYLIWAPHIVRTTQTTGGRQAPLFHMFYCGGGADNTHFEVVHRTSSDLAHWSPRVDAFPPGQDGNQARDPMVLYLSDAKLWAIYYTGTSASPKGYHVVYYRTSPTLADGTWSAPAIAYRDFHWGGTFGPTESPFVLRRGRYYYLFIGPRPYDDPVQVNSDPSATKNWLDPGYVGTDVYRSTDWKSWKNADFVAHLPAHAAEVVEDTSGAYYLTTAGIWQGGLYLMPLTFSDAP